MLLLVGARPLRLALDSSGLLLLLLLLLRQFIEDEVA